MKRVKFYYTIYRLFPNKKIFGDFYFLPMLRYEQFWANDRLIQFRWLIFGVNMRI